MDKKLRVGILFGGRSGEHEISLLSAASILAAIDHKKYSVYPIGITKSGEWITGQPAQRMLGGDNKTYELPSEFPLQIAAGQEVIQGSPAPHQAFLGLDLVFPILHGTFGEDGTIQGLLELADMAYVGSGVLGSAVGMDKDVMKRLFAAAGLPQTPHVTLLRSEWTANPLRCRRLVESRLRYPLFVKPANLGSSVGISKVHDRNGLAPAIDLAGRFDRKIVVEQGVGGPGVKPRELEVAVLGNDEPEVSVIGEIVPNREFYDYDSKYADSETPSVPIVPAKVTAAQQKQIRALALAAFRACDASGLARVDFLMEPARPGYPASVFLNEINTMPGFTAISMFPKLWQASGLAYEQLIDRVIELAWQRRQEKLKTSFNLG